MLRQLKSDPLWTRALVAASLCLSINPAIGAEYASWLVVRYPDGAVKTFLQGPYASRDQCDKLNQTTWSNVLNACVTCTAEEKSCSPADTLSESYAKMLRNERAAVPYVVATPKGRIIVSGVPTPVAAAECIRLRDQFRANGYSDARCVLP